MKNQFENQNSFVKINSIQKKSKTNLGFTLIEIAIVFVIISFLAVGLLKGKSLINSYKTQSVIKDYLEYKSAFLTFKAKYDYWPGDFPNAENYWPGSSNGNGDGILSNVDISDWFAYHEEGIYAWNHLSNEGLTKGLESATAKLWNCYDNRTSDRPYLGRATGTSDCSAYYAQVGGSVNVSAGWSIESGVNAPVGPYIDTLWVGNFDERVYTGYNEGSPRTFVAPTAGLWTNPGYNILRIIGGFSTRGGAWNATDNPKEYKCSQEILIDNKIDDGRPFTGSIMAGSLNCVGGSTIDGITVTPTIPNGQYAIEELLKTNSSSTTIPENWTYKAPDLNDSDYCIDGWCGAYTNFIINEVDKYGNWK